MQLNANQLAASKFKNGIASVVAVPGSGKTLTMTRRIAYLIQHYGIAPESILGLTFTRNAAQAMRDKLKHILNDIAAKVTLSTIHSFCYTILKNEGKVFELLHGVEQIRFIRSIMKKHKIRTLSPGTILREISLAKNNIISEYEFREIYLDDPTMEILGVIYQSYETEKTKSFLMDFNDLIIEACGLLRNNPEIQEKYQQKYLHILVDEFQDTNPAQAEILNLLVSRAKDSSFYVTGDDWQAIFNFIGASIIYLEPFSGRMLFGLIISLLNTRFRAQQLAERLTVDIRESEQSYRNQFVENSVTMLLIDPADGAIIDTNAAALCFYGYTREQLLTMHITDINTLSASEVRQAIASILSKGCNQFNRKHRLSDGSLRDVEVSSSCIQFGGRTVLHSIIHDITERKQAEELLRQLTDRLTLTVRAGGVGIWDYDVVNNKLVWDEQMHRLYGITPDQFSGVYEAWQSGVHPKDMLRAAEETQLALRGEKDFDTEFRVLWPDGTTHNIRSIGLVQRDAFARPLRVIGTNWDITAQMLAEAKIQAALEYAENIVETVREPLLVLNSDLKILTANHSFYDTFKVTHEETVGNFIFDIGNRQWDIPELRTLLKEILPREAIFNDYEVEHNFPDIGRKIILLNARQIFRKDISSHIILLAMEDITKRKLAEAEKAEHEVQNRQLQKAESLNRMADAITHHFINQLHVVIRYLELVVDVLPLGSDESERLIDAMKVSHRAADVSRQMLTYLGQAPGKLERLLQDLSEICHKGLLMIQTFIPKNVSMKPEIPFPGPTIRASVSQMHQIFSALVTNAWESISDNKGTITISVKTVPAADISLSHRFPINWSPTENVYACLEVADTGSGITNADIENVFDPFFTTKYAGRGLNLAVVLANVNAHGGGLTIESEVGKGSIFRVFLPVSAEAVSV